MRAAGEAPSKRTLSASSASRLRHGCSCLREASHSSQQRRVKVEWKDREEATGTYKRVWDNVTAAGAFATFTCTPRALHCLPAGFGFVVVSLRDLRPAPFFAARAISLVLLAKDTTIVNAVNERFGLADRAYVAERKYNAYMAKLERGQTIINDVGRKFGLSKRAIPSAGKQFKSAR
jgi:hypothetical protein